MRPFFSCLVVIASMLARIPNAESHELTEPVPADGTPPRRAIAVAEQRISCDEKSKCTIGDDDKFYFRVIFVQSEKGWLGVNATTDDEVIPSIDWGRATLRWRAVKLPSVQKYPDELNTSGKNDDRWYGAFNTLVVENPPRPYRIRPIGGWVDYSLPVPYVLNGPDNIESSAQSVRKTALKSGDIEFRRFKIKSIPVCNQKGAVVRNRSIRPKDLEWTAAESSSHRIVHAQLKKKLLDNCDDATDYSRGELWRIQTKSNRKWIEFDTSKAPTASSAGYSSELIAVSDFMVPSSFKALFWISGYNHDGYALVDLATGEIQYSTFGYH